MLHLSSMMVNTMVKKVALLLAACVSAAALLGGCTKTENIDDGSSEMGEEELFFLKKDISAELELGDEALVNPFMGFAPNADSKKAASQCSLIYVDITFKELEPSEGTFDFAGIEEKHNLQQWRDEGKHVVLRFLCDKPSDEPHRDIPDWLYQKTADGKDYDVSYGKGYSPNYENQVFIQEHAKAIQTLGEYFGKDTFVSYVELGSLGHWGEWHVKYEDGLPRIPSASVREEYIAPYITAFPNAKILMRRPFESAAKHGFGLYNDMAGDLESTSDWMDWIENGGDYNQAQEEDALVAMKDAWKNAPMGGEFASNFAMDWLLKTSLTQTTQLLASSHTTFLGPKCPISSSGKYDDDTIYQKGVEEVLKVMGYRLGVSKAEFSKVNDKGIMQVELLWTNQGVAPLYFNLPVYLYILDSTGTVISRESIDIKLSELLPGSTVKTATKINIGEKKGKQIGIGIIDPMTGKPAVQLINTAPRQNNISILYGF